MGLKGRIAAQITVGVPLCIGLLFIPAGSFRFWNGWMFLAVLIGGTLLLPLYLYRHDGELLERRRYG